MRSPEGPQNQNKMGRSIDLSYVQGQFIFTHTYIYNYMHNMYIYIYMHILHRWDIDGVYIVEV